MIEDLRERFPKAEWQGQHIAVHVHDVGGENHVLCIREKYPPDAQGAVVVDAISDSDRRGPHTRRYRAASYQAAMQGVPVEIWGKAECNAWLVPIASKHGGEIIIALRQLGLREEGT